MLALYSTSKKVFASLGYIHTDVGAIEDTCVAVLSFTQSEVMYTRSDKKELERIIVERNAADDTYDDDTGIYSGDLRGSVLNPVPFFDEEDYKDMVIVELTVK